MDETTEVVSVHTNEITSPADHITFESSRDLDVSIYDVGDTNEPSNKRKKHDVTINSTVSTPSYALEERLHSILCCSVCLDIPNNSVFQVSIKLIINNLKSIKKKDYTCNNVYLINIWLIIYNIL